MTQRAPKSGQKTAYIILRLADPEVWHEVAEVESSSATSAVGAHLRAEKAEQGSVYVAVPRSSWKPLEWAPVSKPRLALRPFDGEPVVGGRREPTFEEPGLAE